MTDDDEPQKMKILLDRTTAPHPLQSAEVITADCGHECFIASTSKAAMAAHDGPVETVCVPCSGFSTSELIAGINGGDIRAAKGAADEINDEFGFNAVDIMRSRLNFQEIE